MGHPAEAWNIRLVGHSTLNEAGDGSQLLRHGDYIFVGHMGTTGVGTSIVDVRDPTAPRVVAQLRAPVGVHSHKVQIAGDLLLVNHEAYGSGQAERVGLMVYDVSDPPRPREIGFFETGGKGVHRAWFSDGRYAYVSARPPGYRERMFIVIDLLDPSQPKELGRWWVPGVWEAGGEPPPEDPADRFGIHHPVVHGERAYLGMLDAGVAILDISDRAQPTLVGRLQWPHQEGHNEHTALPLPERNLLIVTEEHTSAGRGYPWHIHVVDIADETQPRRIGQFPVPEGAYRERGMWFAPHNLHENRPGSAIDDRFIYATYFNAGLRIYDTADPAHPREVAYYVPESPPGQAAIQVNDVFVDREGLIFVTDRVRGGLYILEWNRAG